MLVSPKMMMKKATPWDALDPDEHEGPSVGKAKASHEAPPDPKAKAPADTGGFNSGHLSW